MYQNLLNKRIKNFFIYKNYVQNPFFLQIDNQKKLNLFLNDIQI